MEESKLISNRDLRTKLFELFNEFDEDNSGDLDHDELIDFMDLLGFSGINMDLLFDAAGFGEYVSFEDLSEFFGLGSRISNKRISAVDLDKDILKNILTNFTKKSMESKMTEN